MNKGMQSFKKILRSMASASGFTIMEMVVVLVVTAIIMVAILPFFKINVDSFTNARMGKDILQSTRIGWNRMMEELKGLEASFRIDQAYNSRIRFDLPGSSNIDYEYDSAYKELRREGVKLIWGVQSFSIKYYDKENNQISTPFFNRTDVWRLKIEMEVGYGTQVMVFTEGQISPRNFYN